MKRLVSLLLSCLLLSSCGTIVTPAKTPPEHLVSEAPPAQGLPAPGEMPELLPDSQEAGGENASEPSQEEGGGTPVETLPEPQRVVDPTRPMVALTFDDGPGKYTQGLLDVLDKYNVKATFFVTNTHPDYQNMIAEEAKRGHTVAIHSASHKYNQIYTSEQAFFDDLEQMNSIIKAQTGNDASIIRFPGGSSNTVSKDYCPGIMTQLVNDVTARGLLYCDWNVSSGDANSKPISTEQVVQNVISGVQSHNVSVVLQHDIKEFSVNAVEQIIQWGQANGYTFLPLTTSSPMSHHRVNN